MAKVVEDGEAIGDSDLNTHTNGNGRAGVDSTAADS
jgi:hypothetical protein